MSFSVSPFMMPSLGRMKGRIFCLKSFYKDFSLSISIDLIELSIFKISSVFVRNALYIVAVIN